MKNRGTEIKKALLALVICAAEFAAAGCGIISVTKNGDGTSAEPVPSYITEPHTEPGQDSVTTQTPVTTAPVTAQTPVTTAPVTTQTPVTTAAVTSQTPVTTAPVTAQTPITTAAVTSQTPVTTAPVTAQTPITTAAVTTQTPVTTSPSVTLPDFTDPSLYSGGYGYDYIAGLSNAGARRTFYSDLAAASLAFHGSGNAGYSMFCQKVDAGFYKSQVDQLKSISSSVAAEVKVTGLSNDEIAETFLLFRYDHPLYYWFPSQYISYSIGSDVYFPVLCADEYGSATVRQQLNSAIYAEMAEMCTEAAARSSVCGIALSVHDRITSAIDYRYGSDGLPSEEHEAHCVLGYFKKTGGVCECFAKTFQMAMNVMGIDNIYVVNLSHAWNLVKFDDGKWYWVDVTYDDNGGNTCWLYFCRNDTEDIFKDSGYIGSGNFIDNKHPLLTPGDGSTPYGGYTYAQYGLAIVYSLPQRAQGVYSGPRD